MADDDEGPRAEDDGEEADQLLERTPDGRPIFGTMWEWADRGGWLVEVHDVPDWDQTATYLASIDTGREWLRSEIARRLQVDPASFEIDIIALVPEDLARAAEEHFHRHR